MATVIVPLSRGCKDGGRVINYLEGDDTFLVVVAAVRELKSVNCEDFHTPFCIDTTVQTSVVQHTVRPTKVATDYIMRECSLEPEITVPETDSPGLAASGIGIVCQTGALRGVSVAQWSVPEKWDDLSQSRAGFCRAFLWDAGRCVRVTAAVRGPLTLGIVRACRLYVRVQNIQTTQEHGVTRYHDNLLTSSPDRPVN
ncbi:hypothetical protein Bbelb_237710 [Branchiostoma belcheri]|nr:hypothetical protein Bbelb_237710 [Branchiostoma belcheri]